MTANKKESLRWLSQAEKDLQSAKNSLKANDYEWACFQSQQSAEKALKSILYARGLRKILTHSVFELIRVVGEFAPQLKNLKKEAKTLDSVYIASRYPNGIAGELAPFEYFEEEDARECIRCAGLILEEAKKLMPK